MPASSTIARSVGSLRGHHRGYNRALAVPNHSQTISPDLRPRPQVSESGSCIFAEIFARRTFEYAAGTIHTAIVHTKRGDAASGKRICQLAKGFVAFQPDLAVTVFLAGARDRDDRPNGLCFTCSFEASACRRE